jgi:hypothetical protein
MGGGALGKSFARKGWVGFPVAVFKSRSVWYSVSESRRSGKSS